MQAILQTTVSKYLLYMGACLFVFYEFILQVQPSVMESVFLGEFHLTHMQMGVLSSAYFWSFVGMQILWGKYYAKNAPSAGLIIASLFCLIGLVIFTLAPSYVYLCIGRAIMGVGSAAVFQGMACMARIHFPQKHFAMLTSISYILGSLGATMGQLGTTFLMNAFGWREGMLVYIGLGLFLVLWFSVFHQPAARALPEEPSSQGPYLWALAILALSLHAPFMIIASLWGVPYLMACYSVSKEIAASTISMMWFLSGVVALVWGPMVQWLGSFRIIFFSIGLGSFGALCLLLVDIPYGVAVFALCAIGALSSATSLIYTCANQYLSQRELASGIGFINMMALMGGALWQPIMGAVVDGLLAWGIPDAWAYKKSFSLLLGLYIVAIYVAYSKVEGTVKVRSATGGRYAL